jgi:integrase/recombinase XerD
METYKDQMQRDMVLRNLSPKTQSLYHRAARDLERHFSKPPDQLNVEDVKTFLHAVVTDRQLSQSSLKIAYSALRFLFNGQGEDKGNPPCAEICEPAAPI